MRIVTTFDDYLSTLLKLRLLTDDGLVGYFVKLIKHKQLYLNQIKHMGSDIDRGEYNNAVCFI